MMTDAQEMKDDDGH